jgi:glycosyltransferase involved in cell wall biosynthesis
MVTLSIIVVNVKGKDNLPKLLESLKRSSYNDFELIVVDNEQISGSFKLIKIEKRSKISLLWKLCVLC